MTLSKRKYALTRARQHDGREAKVQASAANRVAARDHGKPIYSEGKHTAHPIATPANNFRHVARSVAGMSAYIQIPAGLADAISSLGMIPPETVKVAGWTTCAGAGKGKGNQAGRIKLFDDLEGAIIWDWSTGFVETWRAQHRHFTCEERGAFRRQMAETRRQAEREQAEAWSHAAARAQDLWRKAQPANPEHEYLKAKQVAPRCARQSGPRLVLPIVGWNGELSSLQFIGPDGGKLMLKGGRKRGCFIPVHGQRGAERILIAEGFATAATLADAEPQALVLAAIDAGNLEPVAVEVRKQYPTAEIVIAADADQVGISKARAAAIACAGLVAVPEFPPCAEGSDWNDLAALNRKGDA